MANLVTVSKSAAKTAAALKPTKAVSSLLKLHRSVTELPSFTESGTSPYERRKQELLSALTDGKDFSYDAEKDALFGQYKKQYLREGRRAGEHTLGEAAALTGGRASSYAVTAASQAEDNYAAGLADKLPELEAAAYQRYLKEYERKKTALDAISAADKENYSRERDTLADRRYDEESAYRKERDALSDRHYAEETAYQKERDTHADERYAEETAYKKERDAVSDQRYAEEMAYRASELAQKQAALERDWDLQERKLEQDRALALLKGGGSGTADGNSETEPAQISREEAERLKKTYGGTQLSEAQWNRLLAENPDYSGAMLEAAGFNRYQDYNGRAEPTSKAYASAKTAAENLAREGYSNQYIRNRLWTLWRIGSITDSEWREFSRIYR